MSAAPRKGKRTLAGGDDVLYFAGWLGVISSCFYVLSFIRLLDLYLYRLNKEQRKKVTKWLLGDGDE